MPVGSPICAARSGRVLRTIDSFEVGGSDRSFVDKCNLVEIQHSDRSVASYVHLAAKSMLVRKNQYVQVGELIALSGNTGWSAGPHLHFHVTSAAMQNTIATFFTTHRGEVQSLEQGYWYAHQSQSKHIARLQKKFPKIAAGIILLRQRLLKVWRARRPGHTATSACRTAAG